MIPDELKQLRQWVRIPKGLKYPIEQGWQQNPLGWHDIQEPNGRGFLLLGTPYLCIDGDHVLNDGQYVTPWLETFFNGLLQTGTYAELSTSGRGIHVFFKLEPQQDYPEHLNRLKGMSAKGGNYFNYFLPGFDDLPTDDRPHVEIFYNAGQQIFMTGKSLAGDTIQPAPPMLNNLLAEMLAFSVPPAPIAAPVVRSEEPLPASYDLDRATEMLKYISPDILRADWVEVGQILHDLGADVSLWDSWSSGGTKYKGSREIYKTWASFRGSSNPASIATLHQMAKAGGYSERDFMREWHKENQAMQAPAPAIRQATPFNPWAIGIGDLIEAVENGDYEPMKTGIDQLDNIIGGGLMKRRIYCISAPPAAGKTAFCQMLGESTAEANPDCTCLYFCFEMSRAELQARSVARYGHAHGKRLGHLDILQGKQGWRETAEAWQQNIGHKIAYDGMADNGTPTELSTVLDIIEQATAYNATIGRPAPLIILDYLQLLTVGKDEEQEVIKQAMKQFKDFAVKHNTTIIAVVAQNRESNRSGAVDMFSGRGSSSIEYGADFVLSLAYTDDINDDGEEEDRTTSKKTGRKKKKKVDKSRRSVIVTKSRVFESDGRVDFTFNGKYMAFTPCMGLDEGKKKGAVYNSMLQKPPAR